MADPIATGRWAVIIQNDEGEEVVSDIKLMEGGAEPELRNDQKEGGDGLGIYGLEEVPDGVVIGMVRGGPVKAVGGWGFPEGWVGERSNAGATDVADAAGEKPAGHHVAKSRGEAPPAKPEPDSAKVGYAPKAERHYADKAAADVEEARAASRKAAEAEPASGRAKMADDTGRHSSATHAAKGVYQPKTAKK